MSDQSLFPNTEWTFVIEVIQRGEPDRAVEAIGQFYERYRTAILSFFRIQGASPETAEDLTQEFFRSKILAPNAGLIARADRHQARFRTFLRDCLKDFWTDHLRRGGARKRGGGVPHVGLDEIQAAEPASLPSAPPEVEDGFDAGFAEALLALVCPADNQRLIDALVEETRRSALAKDWDMSEGAVKTALSRFKTRFEAAVRDEVRRTLGPHATPADVRAEIQLLMKALARRAVTSRHSSADKTDAGAHQPSVQAEHDASRDSQRRLPPGDRSGPGHQTQTP